MDKKNDYHNKIKKLTSIVMIIMVLLLNNTMIATALSTGTTTDAEAAALQAEDTTEDKDQVAQTPSEAKTVREAEVSDDKTPTNKGEIPKANKRKAESKKATAAEKEDEIMPMSAGDGGNITATILKGTTPIVTLNSESTVATQALEINVSYAVNVIVKFPDNMKNKSVTLKVPEGLSVTDNGSANASLLAFLKDGTANSIKWTGRTTQIYADHPQTSANYANLKNGTITYEFIDGADTVTIPLKMVSQTSMPLISVGDALSPALRLEVFYSSGEATPVVKHSTELRNVTFKPSMPSFEPNSDSLLRVMTDTDVYMTDTGNNLWKINNTAGGVGRAYDYVEWKLSVPKAVEYKGLQKDAFSYKSNTMTVIDNGTPDPTNSKNRIITFRADHLMVANNIFNPIWNFPSDDYGIGDKVDITTYQVVTYPYGASHAYTYTMSGTDAGNPYTYHTAAWPRLQYKHTFVIDNASLVWVNNDNTTTKPDTDRNGITSQNVKFHQTGFDDAIGLLENYSIGNRKAAASGVQKVKMEFDDQKTDKIGVTAAELPYTLEHTLTSIRYKSKNSGGWVTMQINLSPTVRNSGDKIGYVTVSNNGTLGLDVDDYITDIEYEIPSIPANSSQYAYIYGKVLTEEEVTVSSVITACDKNYDPLVADSGSTTGVGTMNAIIQQQVQSYSLSNHGTTVIAAGETFRFSNTTVVAGTASEGSQNCPYPVFYIRDETKQGVTDFALTNRQGVDLVAKYGIQPVLDHKESDGTLVYKVDTSVVATLASTPEEKYDAAIGSYIMPNLNPPELMGNQGYRQLTISYSVKIPPTYRDLNTKHPNSQRLFISSATPAKSVNRVTGTSFRDYYDVNNDGLADSSNDYQNGTAVGSTASKYYSPNSQTSTYIGILENNADTYYQVYVVPDINISTEARHSNATDDCYVSWEKDRDYLQVGVGDSAPYLIRTRLNNDSGVIVDSVQIYQPIPKTGQNWGKLGSSIDQDGKTESEEYLWSVDLYAEITNPDPDIYIIYYGINITPSDDGEVINQPSEQAKYYTYEQLVTLAASEGKTITQKLSEVNCIKYETKVGQEVPVDQISDFVMECTVEKPSINVDQSVNIFSAKYYRNLTNVDDQVFSGWANGTATALQICQGSISGTVYDDLNHNGIHESGEPVLISAAGAVIKLYKQEQPQVPVQISSIQADGTYVFHDLIRGTQKYILEIEYPTGLAGETPAYRFSKTVEGVNIVDGSTNHLFVANSYDDIESSGTASNLVSVCVPGTRTNDGFLDETTGPNGVYDIMFTNATAHVKFYSDSEHGSFIHGADPTIYSDNTMYTATGTDNETIGNLTVTPTANYVFRGWAILKDGDPDNADQQIPDSSIVYTSVTDATTIGFDDVTYYAVYSKVASDVKITKTVTGELGDLTRAFPLVIDIYNETGLVHDTDPHDYKIYNKDDSVASTGTITNGRSALDADGIGMIKIKHGQYIVVTGILDQYSINITEQKADAYRTNVTYQHGMTDTKVTLDNRKTTGKVKINAVIGGENQFDYTNDRGGVIKTGIVSRTTMYGIIIFIIISAFIIWYFRHRKLWKCSEMLK